jgi:hypothetical protein
MEQLFRFLFFCASLMCVGFIYFADYWRRQYFLQRAEVKGFIETTIQAADTIAALRSALKAVEWEDNLHDYSRCPSCGGMEDKDYGEPGDYYYIKAGHKEDCQLAAALAKAEGRTS